MKSRIVCSACLLGVRCRHDGESRPSRKVLELSKKELLIPVCPEQLGGRPTPRELQEVIGGRVFTESGEDVTVSFERGAEEVLRIVRLLGAKKAVFKSKSPACGCGKIYDGTFSGKLVPGDGIVARLLKKNRIKVITEEDI